MVTPMDNGYVLVAERHAQFVKDHPNNLIETTVSHLSLDPGEGRGFVITQTRVWKDRADAAKGFPADATEIASMPIPGVTNFTRNSEAENCATSSLGRALGLLGYHPKDTMASNDEIEMKKVAPARKRKVTPKSDKVNIGRLAEVLARGKALHGGDSKALGEFVKDATGVSKKEELTNAQLDMLEDLFKVKEAEDAGE